MRLSKRDIAAEFAESSGIGRLLGALPTKPVLVALNYHRIGNAAQCPFDSEVFSATADDLDDQVRFLKRRFHIATPAEALEIIETRHRPSGASVLLTFDDGYRDNREIAFPVLSSHGVQAVFFLPTAFVGTNRIPWWDMIAFIVKGSRKQTFRLAVPTSREIDLVKEGVGRAVRAAVEAYRSAAAGSGERFIAMLEEACDSSRPGEGERCFMSWDEAAAMVRGGMTMGSHTHSHEVLARLPEFEQGEELRGSKQILEARLGVRVDTVAYPVGLRDCFSASTQAAAKEAGYRAAFSFYGGFNLPGSITPMDVRRVGIASPSTARFRFQTTLATLTGKYWF